MLIVHVKTPRLGGARLAFTLIELLIVVAIIAILAAIAVPNFLEAQVRSKISRAKADMRSIVTGLECYRMDNSNYPCYPTNNWNSQSPIYSNPHTGFTPMSLTTPVSYLTSLPKEAFSGLDNRYFPGQNAGSYYPNPLNLYNYETASQWNEVWSGNSSSGLWEMQAGDRVKWVLVSVGPNLLLESGNAPPYFHANMPELFTKSRETSMGANGGWYDPTNGTVSSGDIICYGPGTRFDFPSLFEGSGAFAQ